MSTLLICTSLVCFEEEKERVNLEKNETDDIEQTLMVTTVKKTPAAVDNVDVSALPTVSKVL